jgi:hypothetical protein
VGGRWTLSDGGSHRKGRVGPMYRERGRHVRIVREGRDPLMLLRVAVSDFEHSHTPHCASKMLLSRFRMLYHISHRPSQIYRGSPALPSQHSKPGLRLPSLPHLTYRHGRDKLHITPSPHSPSSSPPPPTPHAFDNGTVKCPPFQRLAHF